MIHYDRHGNKIGETRRGFSGYDYYDANGKKIGSMSGFGPGSHYTSGNTCMPAYDSNYEEKKSRFRNAE